MNRPRLILKPAQDGHYFVRRKPRRARRWHDWTLAEVRYHAKTSSFIAYTLEFPAGFHLNDPTLGRLEWSERIPTPAETA